jgi:DNA polymerase III alpha subunit (gram-positive type)
MFDSDGLPICPDCKVSMFFESAGSRDTETMGGYDVSYCFCDKCRQHFEIINDGIYYCDPSKY